jgi:hypothetical protein
VFLDHTPQQKALRAELRAYFAGLMTPDVRAGLVGIEGGPGYRKLVRQIGGDGWLGIGWPVEYGGQGRGAIEQQIWFEESRRARCPLPFVTLNTVGPTLIARGSEAQRQRFLPRILSGEIHFAIGYTEPGSGTDLASLSTTAVRDGDHFLVNGTKIFTSGANQADYIWLACRTDPTAPKHRGISILIVDTKLPGFSCAPIEMISGGRTQMTYYNDVRVPVDMLVGEENFGWKLLTLQLNHERIGLAAFGSSAIGVFEDVQQWAAATADADGLSLIERKWVQHALAEAYALLEAIKVMNWRLACDLENNVVDAASASAAKVFSSEAIIEVYRLLLDVLGSAGTVREGSPGAILRGRVELEIRHCQISTFGGGVNEIQREIVAMLGLHMPRVPR